MLFTIFIAFLSLLALVVLHELGHFFVAKRFNVKVEEFGIGIPPRLWGKRFGETLYSLNALPLGAFVRLLGEEESADDPRSFSKKPVWQRALIVAGGVVAFWIIAAALFSALMGIGVPTAVDDEEKESAFLRSPQVQIVGVAPGSPAEKAGLQLGDVIIGFQVSGFRFQVDRVGQVQEMTEEYKGQEITLTIQRGKEFFDVSLVPRAEPPEGEGAMGIALRRVALRSYSWWQAIWKGMEMTAQRTFAIVGGIAHIIGSALRGDGLPPGAEFMGPVGISVWIARVTNLGLSYYIDFIATIAIYLAIFNALPIPAVDGGKLFFLGLEAVRRKPLPQIVEQRVTALFFFALIALLLFVTFRDISRLL